MIKNIQIKVVWAWLVVATVALSSSLTLISPKIVSAASNYTWAGTTQINSANPKESYNLLSAGSFCSSDGCIYSNFGHTGSHPSNCKVSGIPDPNNDSQKASWPSNINKIIQVANDTGGVNAGFADTTAKTATLYTLSNGSGGNCNVSTTTIALDQGSSSSPNGADYAYTDTSTIRNIQNGYTYKAGGDKTVFNLQYGANNATCPDYIKLPAPNATTGTLNVSSDINAAKCEYNNRPNSDGISGPLPITITRTTPGNIPNDPHTNDQAAQADSCTVPPETTMRWLVCDLLSLGQSAASAMDHIIQNFLFTPTDQVFSPQLKTAWNAFRIIGVVLILIAGLVMVISQAAGLEIFDAYTVKKVLPRLIVAAIGISLSWPIMLFLVTFFNDIGVWAHDIIMYPFKDLYNHAIGSIYLGGATIIIGLPAYLIALGPMGSIALIGTIILGVLAALMVLAIRQLVILMAVVIAPLAIAAYILPGTQKLWEFWKDTFLTSLLMFPIIMGFIAAGKALAAVAASTNSTEMHLLAVLAYFAPYFLLPFAFKLAGGLMSTIFALANDRNKGAFDRLRKSRQAYGAAHRERTVGRRVLQERANMVNNLQGRADRSRSFVAKRALRSLAHGVGGYNIESQMSARRAAVAKELNDQIASGEDDEIRGLTATKQADGTWKSLAGKTLSESAVLRGRQRWGNDSFAQQTALSYEMRKASTEQELQSVADNFPAIARSWGMNDRQATGAWIGAAFENQNQHLEYKNMRIRNGRMTMDPAGYKAFASEVFEKKGSYQMAQMGSNTIEELKKAYDYGDADTKRQVQAIAETFMSRYGSGSGIAALEEDRVIPSGGPTGGGRAAFQTNAPGAGHVAERVRELAVKVGVYQQLPDGTYSESSPPGPNIPRQN